MPTVEQMARDVLSAAKNAGLMGYDPGDPQALTASDLVWPANVLAAHIRGVEAAARKRAAAICRRIQAEADDERQRTAGPGAGSDGAGRAADEIEKGGAT